MSRKSLIKLFKPHKLTLLSLAVCLLMVLFAATYHGGVQAFLKSPGPGESGSFGQPAIGGPFELVDHNGKTFTHEDLKGHYSLLFFGFTFCPDVCPTGLTKLADVYDRLPKELRNNLAVIFVSVDPERDTPEVLKGYVAAFHPDFTGATGTPEQIKDMAKKYLVYYAKRPAAEGKPADQYLVDHSAYTYLMGPGGSYIKHFRHGDTAEEVVAGLKAEMSK